MGAYGNTKEECIAKINSYRNPDKRCTYPFTCDPLGYCWSYATHVDGKGGCEDMSEICPGCECWKESKESEMNRQERIDAQKKYCQDRGFPVFMPDSGICWHCHGDMTSPGDPANEHITGCRHCCRTYCD